MKISLPKLSLKKDKSNLEKPVSAQLNIVPREKPKGLKSKLPLILFLILVVLGAGAAGLVTLDKNLTINYVKATGNDYNTLFDFGKNNFEQQVQALDSQTSQDAVDKSITSLVSKSDEFNNTVDKTVHDLPISTPQTSNLDKNYRAYADVSKRTIKTLVDILDFSNRLNKVGVVLQNSTLGDVSNFADAKSKGNDDLKKALDIVNGGSYKTTEIIQIQKNTKEYLDSITAAFQKLTSSEENSKDESQQNAYKDAISAANQKWQTNSKDLMATAQTSVSTEGGRISTDFANEYLKLSKDFNIKDAPELKK